MGGKKAYLYNLFRSRSFLFITTILLVFFAFNFFRAYWRDYQIRQEITQLEETKKQWEEKKVKLLDKLSDIESDSYVESEARKLGLVKPGEQAIVIGKGTKKVVTEEVKPAENNLVSGSLPADSNPLLWWHYFFAKK
jgi:cell division protein FtsB